MDDYELMYGPDELPVKDDGVTVYDYLEPTPNAQTLDLKARLEHLQALSEQLQRDIPDDSANVLDIQPARKVPRKYPRTIKRIGPVYRRGPNGEPELIGMSFMYQSPTGCYGNRVFLANRDELVTIANELLAITGVEVLE